LKRFSDKKKLNDFDILMSWIQQ